MVTQTQDVKPRSRRKIRLGWGERAIFLGPGLAYLAAFMAVPVVLVILYSVMTRGRFGGVIWEFTFSNFEKATSSIYIQVLVTSLIIAVVTTVVSILLGFPTAYAIARLSPKWRTVALILIVAPFWTNFLIRIYSWMVLLNNEGFINKGLMGIGFTDKPIEMLYTHFAVIVGMVYAYIPLMILPLYASIESLDRSRLEASADLGASRWSTFWRVTWPLTLPGVLIGSIFVFIPTLGNFIVPELLGGGKLVMVGNVIRDQFLKSRDWPFGSALALILIIGIVVLFYFQAHASRRLSDGGGS